MGRPKLYQTEEERKKARTNTIENWKKANTTTFTIRLFNSTDAEVIEKIRSVENKTDYIRQLILKDIEK